MKAVVLKELGKPENLKIEEVKDPVPVQGEVLVRLRAAALNHRDVWIRRGLYAQIRLPAILGSDGAGEVVAVGPGVDPKWEGRRVVINPALGWGTDQLAPSTAFRVLGMPDTGTYAELIAVAANQIHAAPLHLSEVEAAALPLALLTAYRAVVVKARVQPDEYVLVTGIGGGVSTFALQLARQLGARVLVTSRSDAKLARAVQIGASAGVNSHDSDWAKQLVRLCEGTGPHVIIDSIGGEFFAKGLEIIRPGGRLVTYGATTGPASTLEIRRIFWKQIQILGTTMGSPADFANALEFYCTTGLRPIVDQIFPLEDTSQAHQRMEAADQFGKIVLKIGRAD
ncbi:MAG: zinc-binding dehydrogenase [Acidobacteriota bacterium]